MTRDETKAMHLELLGSLDLISSADQAVAAAPGAKDISFGELGIGNPTAALLAAHLERV